LASEILAFRSLQTAQHTRMTTSEHIPFCFVEAAVPTIFSNHSSPPSPVTQFCGLMPGREVHRPVSSQMWRDVEYSELFNCFKVSIAQ
jgi:hypothetical protein